MVGDHGQSGAILRKDQDGTRDLIQELKLQFRHIVGGVWGVLFPPESFGLSADASGQFWTAFMYPQRPDEMVSSFQGYFFSHFRERFSMVLNAGMLPPKVRLSDALSSTSKGLVNVLRRSIKRSREASRRVWMCVLPK